MSAAIRRVRYWCCKATLTLCTGDDLYSRSGIVVPHDAAQSIGDEEDTLWGRIGGECGDWVAVIAQLDGRRRTIGFTPDRWPPYWSTSCDNYFNNVVGNTLNRLGLVVVEVDNAPDVGYGAGITSCD